MSDWLPFTDLEKMLAVATALSMLFGTVGGVSGFMVLFFYRQEKQQREANIKKTRADYAAALAGGYSDFAEDLQEERNRLLLEVNALAKRVLDLEKDNRARAETITVTIDRVRELEKKEKEWTAEKELLLARIAELEKCKDELLTRIAEQDKEIELLQGVK